MIESEDFVLSQAWKGYDNIVAGLNAVEMRANTLLLANSILIATISVLLREVPVYLLGWLLLPFIASLILALGSIHGSGNDPILIKIPDLLTAVDKGALSQLNQLKRKYAEQIYEITVNATSIGKRKIMYYHYSLYVWAGGLGLFIGFLISTLSHI